MRVLAWSRNAPSIALVTANEFCFSTPRIDMQRCVPSQTTGHAERVDFLENRLGDLVGQALLNLEPPGEDIHQAGDLAQADHTAPRNVGDVALAEERQEMVLAQAVEVDVLD